MEIPAYEPQQGPAPEDLVIEDIVVGDGAEAAPSAVVNVHYVGYDYATGEKFDSSYDRGQSIEFPLSNLIAGWQEGIPGMKVGGRRKLVIPPEAAYGPAGTPHPLAGRTLVFFIDLIGTH
ncbi:FKBP-type peptidyl-prolyl cis-trans isomerase [Corynebacterium choanae]|nr:FKBP-type peptidyl-prolyl cis-trans isomerase [Corynebacterium choanae]